MTEIQKLDSKFSNFVRARAGWCCERCGKCFVPPTIFLQCAHFRIRSNKATRFHPNNAIALCYLCHPFFDSEGKKEFEKFMKKRLGKKKYDALIKLSLSIKKESEAIAEATAWLVGDNPLLDYGE